jgi:ankyrin repeat protein
LKGKSVQKDHTVTLMPRIVFIGSGMHKLEGQKIFGNQMSGVHDARVYDQPAILEYILKTSGLSVHSRNGDGQTALHLAIYCGSKFCVSFLLSKGANVKSKDN